MEHVILTQQSEFHPLSVHTKPHIGDPKAYALANPMLKLRSASPAARSFIQDYLPKPPMRAKGHFINHPCGVGLVASLSKCSGTLSDYSKLVQKTVQH